MPRRPIQHQLEDQSERAFASALPARWAWRKQDKDYGIDGEVEIFAPDDTATGLLFKVQLKATESDDPKTVNSIRI